MDYSLYFFPGGSIITDYGLLIKSGGNHSRLRIHWGASDVMLNFSKCVPMKKQLHLGWSEGE